MEALAQQITEFKTRYLRNNPAPVANRTFPVAIRDRVVEIFTTYEHSEGLFKRGFARRIGIDIATLIKWLSMADRTKASNSGQLIAAPNASNSAEAQAVESSAVSGSGGEPAGASTPGEPAPSAPMELEHF